MGANDLQSNLAQLGLFCDRQRAGQMRTRVAGHPKQPAPTAIVPIEVGIGPAQLRLIERGGVIAQEPPNGDDMAFTHAVFCQVGLPRRRVDGTSFTRQSGEAWLTVQSGLLDLGNGPEPQYVPYGALPRVALAWVSTYAKRHKTREVPIGRSASEFLGLLGKNANGGVRGDLTMLKPQMHALAACRLQIGYHGRTFNGGPIEQFDAWFSSAEAEAAKRSRWPGVLVLSQAYFGELCEHGVPLDNRALMALRGSALALDLYCWLAHRLCRMKRTTHVPRVRLKEQFGQEYTGKNASANFWTSFQQALRAVVSVYPDAKVDERPDGLLLALSRPPIPPRTLEFASSAPAVQLAPVDKAVSRGRCPR